MEQKRPKIRDWNAYYKENQNETMPWYNPDLDADLAEILEQMKLNKGRFLDLGTGPATQANALAKMGFSVTGSDISEAAVARASQFYPDIEFVQDDILNTKLTTRFDFVFDRGCFHIFDEDKRAQYIDTVKNLIADGGILFLKCFSVKEKSDGGPHRFSPEEIENYFKPHFKILSIHETIFQGINEPRPKALFTVMKKI